MFRIIVFFVVMCMSLFRLNGQNLSVHENIQQTVDMFLEGLNNRDTVIVKKLIDPNLGLLTVFHDDKKNILAAETLEMLIKSLTKLKSKIYHEEQAKCLIETNNILATAWCKYVFYEGSNIMHCGVNAYQLYKTNKGWKIIQITDSRQTFNCDPIIINE